MKDGTGFLVIILLSLLCCASCKSDIQTISEKISSLPDRPNRSVTGRSIIDLYNYVISLKEDLVNLSDTIRGAYVEDIVRSKVISETRLLKRDNHRMKRQFHEMKKTLGRVQADNNRYRDSLLRLGGEKGELISCTKCIESEVLNSKFAKLDHGLSELNRTLMEQSDLFKSLRNETTTQSPSTVSLTTTALTTPQATTKPRAEMSRILIAPIWSSNKQQFRYVDINNNSQNMYSYLNLNDITSVVYISRPSSLFIGLLDPNKIISSELNSTRVQTVRDNVRTFGMAADEERGIIFLTTGHPSRTISRMTVQGKNLTTLVSLESYGYWPSGIAVNPGTRMIYVCNYYKLFSVRYDGSGLTTLDTGIRIYAVTLDVTHDVLYYVNKNTLVKKSLSSNKSTEVTRFSFQIWNLIYYRDRVYYSSLLRSPGIFGEVITGRYMEANTLQTVEVDGVDTYGICLVP